MAALIRQAPIRRSKPDENGMFLLGTDLKDAREEIFVRMVCDGVALGLAFFRAGFKSKNTNAATNLFHVPRVQERAAAILEARRTQGVVTLPEVTDMLKRVFTDAFHEGEYSAAHNAAFSLARLYGHVTDKATLEVIRRPSRDPDAPTEQALASWVQDLPALAGPGLEPLPEPSQGLSGPLPEGLERPSRGAPAAPLGHREAPEPQLDLSNDINELARDPSIDWLRGLEPSSPELSSDINGLASGPGPTGGQSENGAPSMAVTMALQQRARDELLGRARDELLGDRGVEKKGAPLSGGQVPAFPSAEDLF